MVMACISTSRNWKKILLMLNKQFKHVTRVSMYANGASILAKTDDQLRRLKD